METRALSHPRTIQLLKHFSKAKIIEIKHYKDVFNRRHQNFIVQKNSPALILALKEEPFLYPGAPVCQNFNQKYFYYTYCVMNCIFDCQYCYLQGMYPSANLVFFVNLEDIFSELEKMLKEHPIYLCISYDTDLLALESLLSYCEQWLIFTSKHPTLTIELRTKCADTPSFKQLLELLKELSDTDHSLKHRFIFAFTISPEKVQKTLEQKTSSFTGRLRAASLLASFQFPVRLCLDPLLYVENWKEQYFTLIKTIFSFLSEENIRDISVGTFRVSKEYLKRMRKQRPDSYILQYPYETKSGVFQYEEKLEKELLETVIGYLSNYISSEKIFVWKG